MAMKKNYKYLMVDNDTLKSKLNCLVNELKNIYEDSDGIKYFYGGSKIPAPQFEGYEIECQENVDIINTMTNSAVAKTIHSFTLSDRLLEIDRDGNLRSSG